MKDTTNKDTMNAVDRMIGFLTMRYAFRYNTVMNCTEFRHTGSTEAHFEPLDPRTRRRIILEVQREGIEVSQNDVNNYIESDYVRAFDPVGDYLASCEGAWDGHDHIGDLFAPIVANNGVDESMERITQVVAMMKDRVSFVKELWPLCSFFFIAPTEYDQKTVKKRWKEDSAKVMGELAEVLNGIDDFSIEGQEPVVMKWVEDKGYKLGDVMNAFRLALVGIGKGPGMFDISAFLGKEETIKRLQRAIEVLK